MFYGCSKLSEIDCSSFDTSSVEDMSGMFYQCEGLTSLDLNNFETPKVKNMNQMFGYCPKLESLILVPLIKMKLLLYLLK